MAESRPAEGIRDRVVDLWVGPAKELRVNPRNWRRHPANQRNVLRLQHRRLGNIRALVARKLEDGGLELVDGHLRAELLDEQEVAVLVTDLTQEEADQLLATMDPLAALADADVGKLAEIVDGLPHMRTDDFADFFGISSIDYLPPAPITRERPETEIPGASPGGARDFLFPQSRQALGTEGPRPEVTDRDIAYFEGQRPRAYTDNTADAGHRTLKCPECAHEFSGYKV